MNVFAFLQSEKWFLKHFVFVCINLPEMIVFLLYNIFSLKLTVSIQRHKKTKSDFTGTTYGFII